MYIELKRIAKKPTYTIGKFYINGVYFCDTIEDKDRGLTNDMTEAEIKRKKVYGETAIPIGRYTVDWTMSAKYGKMMPEVKKVKGFSGIRIHSGNTAKDSLGCILLGKNTEVGKVTSSRVWTNKFYEQMKSAIERGEGITLDIK